MNEKQAKQALIAVINEKVSDIMRVFMADTNSGDESIDLAVQYDECIDRLASILVEIKKDNIK